MDNNFFWILFLNLCVWKGGQAQSFTTIRLDQTNEQRNEIYEFVPNADFARYPLVKYRVDDTGINGIRLGDTIPDYLWNLPLWTVNHPDGKDTLRLRDYQNSKLLVLDFWSTWCSPCIESMNKWESYVDSLDGEALLIGIMLDYDYKALPFIQKRGWKSPTIIGGGAWLLNRYFFDRSVISRMAWIKDGKLAAITSVRGYDLDLVKQMVEGKKVTIPIDSNWTYFAKKDIK